MSEKQEISSKQRFADLTLLKGSENNYPDSPEKAKLEVQKMATLAEVGSHVVAGALAAAHASASLSQSENTQITG